MSACCSLDEPGKPSFVEHPSRLPPRQIAQSPRAHASHQVSQQCRRAPATPDTADPAAPTQLQRRRVPAAARRTRGPEGCSPGRRARLPHQRACTGGSRLWFPIIRLAFQKLSSGCGNFGGRRWVRTTGFSLVRRKQPTIKSSSQSRLHTLDLRKPCPEMPRDAWESLHGGSRKWFLEQHRRSAIARHRNGRPPPHLLTPRSKSELGSDGRPSEPRPAGLDGWDSS
jgi:hypothetical protein